MSERRADALAHARQQHRGALEAVADPVDQPAGHERAGDGADEDEHADEPGRAARCPATCGARRRRRPRTRARTGRPPAMAEPTISDRSVCTAHRHPHVAPQGARRLRRAPAAPGPARAATARAARPPTSLSPRGGSGRRHTTRARSEPGTPTRRNAQRQPGAARRPRRRRRARSPARRTAWPAAARRRGRARRAGSSRRSATATPGCRPSRRRRARRARAGTARRCAPSALRPEIAPHDASTTAMIRVRRCAVGQVAGRQHHEEPGEDERGAEEPGLGVAEAEVVLHLGEDAGQDAAVDRVDERHRARAPERGGARRVPSWACRPAGASRSAASRLGAVVRVGQRPALPPKAGGE